jgi:hypothetical protein
MMPINTPPLIHDVDILVLRHLPSDSKISNENDLFGEAQVSPRIVEQFEFLQTKDMQVNFSDIDEEFERIYLQH